MAVRGYRIYRDYGIFGTGSVNMDDVKIIRGAEAVITPGEFLGRRALVKTRPAKAYRHPDLDRHIRSVRTRNEARLIHEERLAGVRTPCIYDIDLKECSITMELLEGTPVKEVLDEHPECAEEVCRKIGRTVARMHSAGICHGDLTTSNMILVGGEVCLIYFSMGCTRAEVEDIGVDMRLLERAFTSAHIEFSDAFDALMEEYYANVPEPKQIRKKIEDIRNRGRYT